MSGIKWKASITRERRGRLRAEQVTAGVKNSELQKIDIVRAIPSAG